jgi:hypothetical protein
MPAMSFAERYGPWALVAGASDGTGREFARQLAARGVLRSCWPGAKRRWRRSPTRSAPAV